MRKKQHNRISVTKAFTFPPDLAGFIEQRTEALKIPASRYMQKLVEADQNKNTYAEALRDDAERAAAA